MKTAQAAIASDGLSDFTQNNPGIGRHQMNCPGNVAITPDGKRIAVTDTNNDRILIWNSFRIENGAPTDLVLDLSQLSGNAAPVQPIPPRTSRRDAGASPQNRFRMWTDGKRFAVVVTHGSAVLIWDSLPTRDDQPPDLVLRPRDAGTPRNVTSDGSAFFAVSDHNNGEASRPATMVWRRFPTVQVLHTRPPVQSVTNPRRLNNEDRFFVLCRCGGDVCFAIASVCDGGGSC